MPQTIQLNDMTYNMEKTGTYLHLSRPSSARDMTVHLYFPLGEANRYEQEVLTDALSTLYTENHLKDLQP